MGKKQANSDASADSTAGAIDSIDEAGEIAVSEEADADIDREEIFISDELDIDETPCNAVSAKARERLETKKRLDAYLEKQLLKESGWDEDDELFDDEFFSEPGRGRA